MSFLTDYAALADTITIPTELAKAQNSLTRHWLKTRHIELFQELRAQRPVFLAPGLACVACYTDVKEVLSRDRVFTIQPYTARMQRTTGDFFLGMQRSPQYDREVSIMRLSASRGDIPRLKALVADTAKELITASKGQIDLVNGYARAVALRVVESYFGVPGPDNASLANWMRILFWDIFLNLGDEPGIRERADIAATALKEYLARHIENERAALQTHTAKDTVLVRLLRMQAVPDTALDDDAIRRNIGGTITGAVETVSRAFVQAFEQLFKRPLVLKLAQTAAASGDQDTVDRCILECMRFNPQNPYLYRLCEESHTLSSGTPHATTIPKGTLVFAGTQSAMFDEKQLTEPNTIRMDRRPEDYLFFGFGQHTCFGQYIAQLQFSELARQILLLPNLRLESGSGGQIHYEGPFPQSFQLEWGS